MDSRTALLLPLLALAGGPALAANPFASAGAHGVGEGMRAVPGKLAGTLVSLEDDAAKLTPDPGKQVSICTDELQPVAGRLIVEGQWKTQGVDGTEGWHGARVKLYYFDSDKTRVKGQAFQPQLAFAKGDSDWTSFTQSVIVPDGAAHGRLCVELVGVTAGTAWVKDLGLGDLSGSAEDQHKNVVWILVDTLRGDALGTHGGPKGITPNIDDFADDSIVYERAWTQYTWTVPSTISFFTSQFARTHGWNSTFEKVAAGDYTEMGEDVPTLAQVLREEGFVTSAHYANGLLKSGIGVGRGFLTWRHGNDEEVVKRSLEDIALWDGDGAPNFLYAHLMTPHIPLRPTGAAQRALGLDLDVPADGYRYYEGPLAETMSQADYNDLFADAYHATVFDADRYVNQILSALEQAGHAEDTIVVLTSDHGELIGEHGILGHGSYVYEGLTWVPLIVRAPGVSAKRVSDRVGRTVDVAPTVLDWLELDQKQPEGWQGVSLLESKPGLIAVSERDYRVAFTTDGRWKTVENRERGELLQAFDLEDDPGEKNALSDLASAQVKALQKAADRWRSAALEPGQEVLQTRKVIDKSDKEKDEELEMLRALGYVD